MSENYRDEGPTVIQNPNGTYSDVIGDRESIETLKARRDVLSSIVDEGLADIADTASEALVRNSSEIVSRKSN